LTACFSIVSDSSLKRQYFSISFDHISLLKVCFVQVNLFSCISLAFSTFSLIVFEVSHFGAFFPNFSVSTFGTSINISILSTRGQESLALYFSISLALQIHCFFGSVINPQGQGFIAPTNINLAG
jgi:hypothetical protein